MPALWPRCSGTDAKGRVPALLRVRCMPHDPKANLRRLLRVLFVWRSQMPAEAAGIGRKHQHRQVLTHRSLLPRSKPKASEGGGMSYHALLISAPLPHLPPTSEEKEHRDARAKTRNRGSLDAMPET